MISPILVTRERRRSQLNLCPYNFIPCLIHFLLPISLPVTVAYPNSTKPKMCTQTTKGTASVDTATTLQTEGTKFNI